MSPGDIDRQEDEIGENEQTGDDPSKRWTRDWWLGRNPDQLSYKVRQRSERLQQNLETKRQGLLENHAEKQEQKLTNPPKLVVQAQEHLEPGEQILAFVPGTYETKRFGQDSVRSGVLIATDRRVVFYAKKLTGYELESFPYENISSFEQGKNFMGAHLKLFASGNEVMIKWIKGDVASLAREVKQRMKGGTASTPAPQQEQPEPDVADQIRKLAELRDAGILTEEEFTAKKRQLLGI